MYRFNKVSGILVWIAGFQCGSWDISVDPRTVTSGMSVWVHLFQCESMDCYVDRRISEWILRLWIVRCESQYSSVDPGISVRILCAGIAVGIMGS